jgi:hypothetical protein
VPGRGAILRSLRGLVRRVERFGERRARTPEDRAWSHRLADALDAAFREALAVPGGREALAAVDQRRARARKTPQGQEGARV